jgi:hypothetical protein
MRDDDFFVLLVIVAIIAGHTGWMMMTFSLGSFLMLALWFFPLSWLVTVPTGIYYLCAGVPLWIGRMFL